MFDIWRPICVSGKNKSPPSQNKTWKKIDYLLLWSLHDVHYLRSKLSGKIIASNEIPLQLGPVIGQGLDIAEAEIIGERFPIRLLGG